MEISGEKGGRVDIQRQQDHLELVAVPACRGLESLTKINENHDLQ